MREDGSEGDGEGDRKEKNRIEGVVESRERR